MASERDPAVAGSWHPAGSSRTVAATARPSADGRIAMADGDGKPLVEDKADAFDVSERIGSTPRIVTHRDGSVFETRDNDGIDRLFGHRRGLVDQLEQFRPRLFVFAALVIALSVAIYRFGVPVLVEIAVAVTPPVVPQLMSASAMASLDQTVFAPSTLETETQERLKRGFAELVEADGANGNFSLNFREGGAIGPNAFALPDGTIVLTDELVRLAGRDEDAILGVLGHEIGHVADAHTLRRLYTAAGAAALIMLIGGDMGSGVEELLVQGSALLTLSYSRDQEREADRHAVELMAKAGKDPEAIARFFELLRDRLGGGGGPGFLSTHPDTAERIEDARRYAEEISGKL